MSLLKDDKCYESRPLYRYCYFSYTMLDTNVIKMTGNVTWTLMPTGAPLLYKFNALTVGMLIYAIVQR